MVEYYILVLAFTALLIAVLSARGGWNPSLTLPSIKLPSGQYSLRSLILLLTLAPPLIGLYWTHGDDMSRAIARLPPLRRKPIQSRVIRPRSSASNQARYISVPASSSVPALSSVPASSSSVNRKEASRLTQELTQLHDLAGWATAVLFSTATILMGTVFYRAHDWTRPPRKSPLTWAAFLMALLAAAMLAAFVLTDFRLLLPPNDDPFKGS